MNPRVFQPGACDPFSFLAEEKAFPHRCLMGLHQQITQMAEPRAGAPLSPLVWSPSIRKLHSATHSPFYPFLT